MRYARTEKGQRRFTVYEFLSAQQIQGYFSRAAAKLRHATAPQSGRESDESNIHAAQNDESHSLARTAVLYQCHPVHPIVHDNLNKEARLAHCRTASAHLQPLQHGNISYLGDLVGTYSCMRF